MRRIRRDWGNRVIEIFTVGYAFAAQIVLDPVIPARGGGFVPLCLNEGTIKEIGEGRFHTQALGGRRA